MNRLNECLKCNDCDYFSVPTDNHVYKMDMNTIKVYDVQGWKTLSPSSTLNLILNNENFQPLIIKQVEKDCIKDLISKNLTWIIYDSDSDMYILSDKPNSDYSTYVREDGINKYSFIKCKDVYVYLPTLLSVIEQVSNSVNSASIKKENYELLKDIVEHSIYNKTTKERLIQFVQDIENKDTALWNMSRTPVTLVMG